MRGTVERVGLYRFTFIRSIDLITHSRIGRCFGRSRRKLGPKTAEEHEKEHLVVWRHPAYKGVYGGVAFTEHEHACVCVCARTVRSTRDSFVNFQPQIRLRNDPCFCAMLVEVRRRAARPENARAAARSLRKGAEGRGGRLKKNAITICRETRRE